jgi:hypothetical protein
MTEVKTPKKKTKKEEKKKDFVDALVKIHKQFKPDSVFVENNIIKVNFEDEAITIQFTESNKLLIKQETTLSLDE